MEQAFGVEIPELGFPRGVLTDYDDAPPLGTPEAELPWVTRGSPPACG
jgi:hypothetical protein